MNFYRIFLDASETVSVSPSSLSAPVSSTDTAPGIISSFTDVISDSAVGASTLPVGTVITVAVIVFALIMLGFEIIRSRYVLSTTRREIVLDDLPEAFDGTRIALISDLHQMRFGDFNEELAKHVRREFPDYVLFAGNMADAKKYNVDAFYDFIDSLGSDIPLIMVPGQDDLRIGGGAVHRNFAREMEHAGALLLNNTCAELISDKSKLYVYGFCPPLEPQEDVDAKEWSYAEVSAEDLPSVLGRCPTDAPVLLLAHDPRPFEAYCKWGAQIILSGYSYGGMVRIPHFGGVFPVDGGKLFPEYDGGEYVRDNSRMIVSRGLGSPRGLRFLNAPEITIITLSLPESRKPAPASGEEKASEEKTVTSVSLFDRFRNQAAIVSEWASGEFRSLRELLYERSIQIRDFFSLMFGKKRSRFAKAADDRKRQNTYIAPKKPKKQIPDRSKTVDSRSGDYYKRKGQFTVKPSARPDRSEDSFGTNYDTSATRTGLDDERSDLFLRTDRNGSDRENPGRGSKKKN